MLAIEQAADLLRSGGLVAFPTETVYGLGANALLTAACRRIFEAKGRPLSDPLIVHVAPTRDLFPTLISSEIIAPPSHHLDQVQLLARTFWPGPLTLLLSRGRAISTLITAGHDSVAIRVPSHPLAQQLLALAGVPVAAPSANRFGRISPTTADHVRAELGQRVDMIVDGGPCAIGIESTILDVSTWPFRILRYGGLAREQIESVLGDHIALLTKTAHNQGELAPGMMDKHYAPATRLHLCNDSADLAAQCAQFLAEGKRVGVLAHSDLAPTRFSDATTYHLGKNIADIARNLYAGMRTLDAADIEVILIVKIEPHGLGAAVADRLARAAT